MPLREWSFSLLVVSNGLIQILEIIFRGICASIILVRILSRKFVEEKDSCINKRYHYSEFCFCIELGETGKIFDEYDSTMEKNVLPGNLFPLLDASSLLWRLQVSHAKIASTYYT